MEHCPVPPGIGRGVPACSGELCTGEYSFFFFFFFLFFETGFLCIALAVLALTL